MTKIDPKKNLNIDQIGWSIKWGMVFYLFGFRSKSCHDCIVSSLSVLASPISYPSAILQTWKKQEQITLMFQLCYPICLKKFPKKMNKITGLTGYLIAFCYFSLSRSNETSQRVIIYFISWLYIAALLNVTSS